MMMMVCLLQAIVRFRGFSSYFSFLCCCSGDLNHNHSEPSSSGGLAEELKELEMKWLKRKQEQEEADRAFALKLQQQLDQQEVARTPVNRSKGSKDEYQLRRNSRSSSKQQKIEDSFQRPPRKSAP